MNMQLVGGIAAVVYGALMGVLILLKDDTILSKRKAMQEKWGEAKGGLIHTIAYSVVPAALGAFLIIKALLLK